MTLASGIGRRRADTVVSTEPIGCSRADAVISSMSSRDGVPRDRGRCRLPEGV
jgi:hypothetical protein